MRLKTYALVGAVSASLVVANAFVPVSAQAHSGASFCPVHYVAHRGEGWPSPNTEDGSKAIRAAIKDPDAYGVESDQWATSDNKALMQHDSDLSISTNGTGKVGKYTLAYIQNHFRMDDGTKPQSALGYLRQVVHAKQHAVLHLKSSSDDGLINKELGIAHAREYVRPMATSLAQAKYFVGHGWYTELLVKGAAPAARVAAIKKAKVTAVLVVDPSATKTPATWIQPYIKAGITTDYVSYSKVQDKEITKFAFNRVLSGDIAATISNSGCKTAAK